MGAAPPSFSKGKYPDMAPGGVCRAPLEQLVATTTFGPIGQQYPLLGLLLSYVDKRLGGQDYRHGVVYSCASLSAFSSFAPLCVMGQTCPRLNTA